MNINKHIGSTLESFLEEQGILEEVRAKALKKALAYQLKEAMVQQNLTQSELAKRMGTSRAVLQRLLNSNNTSVTLHTLNRVAYVLGRKLHIYID